MKKLYVCGNVSLKAVGSKPVGGGNVVLAETHWEMASRTKMGCYLTQIEQEFFEHAIDFSRCRMVCDVGSGAGKFSLLAAQNGAEIVALDVGRHELRRLKAKNSQVDLVLADAKALPLRSGCMDAVFSMETLDYIENLERVFLECSGVLKAGGTFVFSLGNTSSFKCKVKQVRGSGYLHSYAKALSALINVGFHPTAKQGYNWLPFNRTSENTLVPLLAKMESLLGLRKVPKYSP